MKTNMLKNDSNVALPCQKCNRLWLYTIPSHEQDSEQGTNNTENWELQLEKKMLKVQNIWMNKISGLNLSRIV